MTGGNIETSIICECEGICSANNWIYGGGNNEFAHYTKLCFAAYYAELIPVGIFIAVYIVHRS